MIDLITTEKVTYTTPSDAAALRALRRLEQLWGMEDAGNALTEELRAEIAQLEGTLPDVREVRLTLRSATALDAAKYELRRAEMVNWFEAETGRAVADVMAEESGVVKNALGNVFDQAQGWAVIMTVLVQVEQRTRPLQKTDVAWNDAEIPPKWYTSPADFLTWAPDDLVVAALDAAKRLSPGVWGLPDPLARRYGGVNVTTFVPSSARS